MTRKTTSSPRTGDGRRRFGTRRIAILIAIHIAFFLGYVVSGGGDEHTEHDHANGAAEEDAENGEMYTCSMHPEVRMPDPDDLCPICNMSLIPVGELDEEDDDDDDIPRLRVSTRARALMQIETSPAERRAAEQELRLFGRVDYDETRTNDVTLLAAGQIQRLRIDYSNARVDEGELLADVYSPEVLGAAEEFLVAARAGERRGTDDLARQARRRLTLLGVTPPEVDEILERGEAQDTYRVYSPANGIITELGAQEGDWVNQGQRLARIVDLSQVWVQLEAYERDLQWLRYGQSIEFTTEAYPGEVFEGQIAFISPTVDQDRRTVRVRANVDNPDGRLKPDMFLRGTVHSQVAAGGRVMDPDLEGKWISPTHPEIIRDEPGECPRSGRSLVRAEDLGYTAVSPDDAEMPLLIPRTAPLITGKRAVVYVEIPGEERPTFEARNVTLGPRVGDYYIVENGLEDDAIVVTHGNFRIDSELQIRGRPSMMRPAPEPEDEVEERLTETLHITADIPDDFTEQLGDLVHAYVDVSESLANDDFEAAQDAASAMFEVLDAIDDAMLEGDAAEQWALADGEMRAALSTMAEMDDLDGLRQYFEPLSNWMAAAVEAFGSGDAGAVYLMHCPMAFDDRGADWLQLDEEVRNPYFGDEMYRCGEAEMELTGAEPALPPDDLEVPEAFAEDVAVVWEAYLDVSEALSDDEETAAREAAERMQDAVTGADAQLLEDDEAARVWGEEHGALYEALDRFLNGADMEAIRAEFEAVSEQMKRILVAFHGDVISPVYVLHCPMAFDDEGADWLQADEEVRNPYFGAMMYSCGEVTETLLEE